MPSKIRQATRNTQAGFTLIEMLVVVAIIAVITAIVLPIIANKREERRRAVCNDHLAYSMGLAIIQYTQDYDETYPRIMNGAIVPGRSMSWRRAILPYAKDVDGFRCPTNPASNLDSVVDGLPLSYDVADSGPIRRSKPMKLNQVPSGSQTILVFEENIVNPQTQQVGVAWDQNPRTLSDTNILYGGHNGMVYYLFADGHVRTLRPADTIANGVNMWHVNNHDPVTPGALQKLQAAQRNFG